MTLAPGHGSPARKLYAPTRSSCACAATASPRCIKPECVHGPKPVIALPGLMPIAPPTAPPVTQVTVVPARMANAESDLRSTIPADGGGGGAAVDVALKKLT